MKSKKGAFELSVSALVILILAIVMLGLGIGFIRGMFGKVTTNIEEIAGSEPDPARATANYPISLSKTKAILNLGEATAIKASVYSGGAKSNQVVNITCSGDVTGGGSSSGKAIPERNSVIFTALIEAGATTGSQLCTFIVGTDTDGDGIIAGAEITQQAEFTVTVR